MNTCSICRHKKAKQIESALIAGASLRDIEGQFDVSRSSVDRHKNCIAGNVSRIREKNGLDRAVTLIEQLNSLRDQTEQILTEALETDGELALKAIDRRHKQIEIEAKLTGEFQADRENEHDVSPEQLAEIRKLKAEREESISDNN